MHAIIVSGAEKAEAKIVVGEDKATKVGNEGLYSGTHGNEIVVCVYVPQFHFAKCLFQRDMCIGAVGASSDVDVHDAILAGIEIVWNAEGWRDLNRPIARLEGCVAVEKFKAELNSFAYRQLFRLAEELAAAGFVAAQILAVFPQAVHTGRRRYACRQR